MMFLGFSCSASRSPLQLPSHLQRRACSNKNLKEVKKLLAETGIPSIVTSPSKSLQNGTWVKLICGASFEDLADIRNLSLVYTLSGVDCIDCAAEASVVNAVNDGIEAARAIIPIRRPWVMISVNDDEDLHFRKAEFDPDDCPMDCSRPCENVCPANAISFLDKDGLHKGGVLAERCYGCGRCLPVCPFDKISAFTYKRDVVSTAELIRLNGIDAIEIHTSGRNLESFQQLWNGLRDSVNKLELVAVSLPYMNEQTIPAMNSMYEIMKFDMYCRNLWQLDGRPMSGDIGRGATREAIKFAVHLSKARDKPPGFLQLAGGTNAYTIDGLKKERLFKTTMVSEKLDYEIAPLNQCDSALIGGVAFGGYARKIVGRILSSLPLENSKTCIEACPHHLLQALTESLALVGTVKLYG